MKRIFLTICLLVFAGACIFSMGAKTDDLEKNAGKNIKISGVLSIVGNEPFTKMGVRTTNGILFYLSENDKKKYNNLISENVTAEGILQVFTVYTADHKKKFRECFLSNAVILKDQPDMK